MQENKIKIKTLKIMAMDSDTYEHSISDINDLRKIIDILDVISYEDLIYSMNTMVKWENRSTLENNVKAEGIAVELYEKINHLIVSNMHIVKECLDNRKCLLENDLRTELLQIIKEKHITNFKDLIDYLEECKNKKYASIVVINEKDCEEEVLPDTFTYNKAEYYLVRHYERLITYVVKETVFFMNYLGK